MLNYAAPFEDLDVSIITAGETVSWDLLFYNHLQCVRTDKLNDEEHIPIGQVR